MASQITSLTIVYSTAYSGADQRKHHSSASLALCGNSQVTGEFPVQMASNAEMFPFDDVIMLDGGSASAIRSRHLISDTGSTAEMDLQLPESWLNTWFGKFSDATISWLYSRK